MVACLVTQLKRVPTETCQGRRSLVSIPVLRRMNFSTRPSPTKQLPSGNRTTL
jgi:hypothetical protein